jgi:hypothetical protein
VQQNLPTPKLPTFLLNRREKKPGFELEELLKKYSNKPTFTKDLIYYKKQLNNYLQLLVPSSGLKSDTNCPFV